MYHSVCTVYTLQNTVYVQYTHCKHTVYVQYTLCKHTVYVQYTLCKTQSEMALLTGPGRQKMFCSKMRALVNATSESRPGK